ncbi:UDP-glucose dehydrogenase family protein [Nocardia seriolae]|uniref:UDP-glucose 6-dehydrogenase n=1 Tax=Nocardia seriolae TaxID=37332 RepID=A0ABC8AM65_9NOCA|nr:UDP-glucose/GDP-mannose dehydrogenase family protein [Nocardia seriolae]APA95313.1 GDP-mannose 6-dehydrogenase [Nocardia seriolae]OJF78015.1 UDP-glucose 6-dehydrogenase [Nocardia seriolae]QUN19390.1 UDP-glucose/GDP-mannose dehydrogenase family protein [Nocardia seriolae]WNJ58835.1 UDP-glucose/GDP-mannose dehydrogenase family protein [Nocardia seriolae]BEK99601.1 UDP-glucose/GDP-mannose dehydrogenase family protein [Nocardia seriolae]
MLRISVIGTGYLGATHAAGMAELGFEVLGVDNNPAKAAALSAGQVPFHEPGLPELLAGHVAGGRLRFGTSLIEAAEFADVHFLCVGTPPGVNGAADLSQLYSALDGLVPHLTRNCLIVGKSTVPVGTAEALTARIAELAPEGISVDLAWNPEFLREGHAVFDTLNPNRLVFGVTTPDAEWALRQVYATPIAAGAPVVITNMPTAELIKVSANAFLATKISFINAMAELCDRTGADVTLLADALGHDDRIGRKFLGAGLGYGGGCLPKDVRALIARATELGAGETVECLRDIDAVNLRRRERVVAETLELLGGGRRPSGRVGVLGAAFKPLSDDVRDSPALDVAARLHAAGVDVTVFDPAATVPARAVAPQLVFAATATAALHEVDVVLHLTEWREFRELDPVFLRKVARGRVIIDARNTLDPEPWLAAGWDFRALGRLVERTETRTAPARIATVTPVITPYAAPSARLETPSPLTRLRARVRRTA